MDGCNEGMGVSDGFDGVLCVSIARAARAMDVCRRTVERMMASGELAWVSVRSKRRILVADLREWIKRNRKRGSK